MPAARQRCNDVPRVAGGVGAGGGRGGRFRGREASRAVAATAAACSHKPAAPLPPPPPPPPPPPTCSVPMPNTNLPMERRRSKLSSSPMLNSRNTTPSSARGEGGVGVRRRAIHGQGKPPAVSRQASQRLPPGITSRNRARGPTLPLACQVADGLHILDDAQRVGTDQRAAGLRGDGGRCGGAGHAFRLGQQAKGRGAPLELHSVVAGLACLPAPNLQHTPPHAARPPAQHWEAHSRGSPAQGSRRAACR